MRSTGSTDIDAFLFAQNSDIPKRLDIFLLKGMTGKDATQRALDMLENVSIKAWDERGVLVNYHSPSSPDVFVLWSAINYIKQHQS